MTRNTVVPSKTMISRKKYSALCSLLRGSSISANHEHLAPGGLEALKELESEGICFLDKSGIREKGEVSLDAGDEFGRYRLVSGKQGEAQEMVDHIDEAESQRRKRG